MNGIIRIFQNGALVAITAQGMIGLSLVWDKVLLRRPGTRNLFSYVFWLGSLSLFGLAVIPFGYKSPALSIIGIAFASGVLDLAASFFYYAALKRGEASETLALMGGFSPVATALFAVPLLSRHMTGTQVWGFAVMTLGGFVMFFSEKLPLRRALPPVLLASVFFGLSNVLAKFAYDRTNFVTGFVWFAIGSFVAAMSLLIHPSWRRQIFSESGQSDPRSRFWYLVNRFGNGLGSFLVVYAISLTHPALVDAISGIRYVVIFIGAYLITKFRPSWLRENFTGFQVVTKILGTALVIAGVVVVGLAGGGSGSTSSASHRALLHDQCCYSARFAFPTQNAWSKARASPCLYRPPNTNLRSLRTHLTGRKV
jgi:uncharacterized membrane protein